METLKYKVISSKAQYKAYAAILEELVFSGARDHNTKDEIALLTLLIEKWDEAHNTFTDLDPIQLLYSLMREHNLKAKDLVAILDVSKGYVSDILHYKKGLSKEVIRTLSSHFKVRQDAFNRPYQLIVPEKAALKDIA
jgi:HTH-type transcriptional regulator/antitoxin HigA